MSIINKLKSLRPTALIIIFLIILTAIIAVLAIKPQTSTPSSPVIKRQPSSLPSSPLPSPITIPLDQLPSYQDLNILKILPKDENFPAGDTRNAFFIYFDQPVDPNTVKITSDPQLTFQVKILPDDPTRINIIPTTPWQTNQVYFITIHQGIASTDSQSALKNDVYKTLTIKSIPLPVFDRPN